MRHSTILAELANLPAVLVALHVVVLVVRVPHQFAHTKAAAAAAAVTMAVAVAQAAAAAAVIAILPAAGYRVQA